MRRGIEPWRAVLSKLRSEGVTDDMRANQMRLLFMTVGGIGLIVVGFTIFVDPGPWPSMVKLNLGTACAVYLINVVLTNRFAIGGSTFAGSIPSLGMMWVADGIYTVAAIGGIALAWIYHLSFEIALMYQWALLFGLISWAMLAREAAQHSTVGQANRARGLIRIDELRDLISQQHAPIDAFCVAQPEYGRRLAAVRDELRFLSPSTAPGAPALDEDLRREVSRFQASPAADSLIRIEELVRARKNIRHPGDHVESLS